MNNTAIQSAAPEAAEYSVHIGPSVSIGARLREAIAYRDLLYALTGRDIRVRYKQTVLGAAWAVLQPLFMMLAFAVFFGRLAKVPSDGVPYTVFALCALLPWQLFSHGLSESSNSLILNQRLITKVYFPRVLVPLSAVLSGLVDFVLSLVILLIFMGWYRIAPTAALLALPVFLLMALLAAFGVGLWLSALNVQYRDVRYTINFLTQVWMFATPIAYSTTLVPGRWRLVYALNPMVGVIEGFRWALLGTHSPTLTLPVSAAMTLILLISGWCYFHRVERTFADVV